MGGMIAREGECVYAPDTRKMRTVLPVYLLTVLAVPACVIVSNSEPETPNEVATLPDQATYEDGGSRADYAAEVERLRALEAKTERLEAEIARKQRLIAALEEEARDRTARHVERVSIWEGWAMLVISVTLATLASRRWGLGKRS
jgi:hypothetical protein